MLREGIFSSFNYFAKLKPSNIPISQYTHLLFELGKLSQPTIENEKEDEDDKVEEEESQGVSIDEIETKIVCSITISLCQMILEWDKEGGVGASTKKEALKGLNVLVKSFPNRKEKICGLESLLIASDKMLGIVDKKIKMDKTCSKYLHSLKDEIERVLDSMEYDSSSSIRDAKLIIKNVRRIFDDDCSDDDEMSDCEEEENEISDTENNDPNDSTLFSPTPKKSRTRGGRRKAAIKALEKLGDDVGNMSLA